MEFVIKINTLQPPSPEQIRADAAFLIHVADNHATFFSAAPGAPASVFGKATAKPEGMVPPLPVPAAAVTPPPPPGAPVSAPPAPTSHGDGSATDLLPRTASADLDKNGLPWDARIHSSSKAKTAKDEWKKLRGVDDALVAAVTAELLGKSPAAPAAAPAMAPPPPPPAPAAAANVPPIPPAPPAASAPVAPPPPPAGADANAMQKAIIDAVTAGKFGIEDVNAACMNLGYGNMGEVKAAGMLPMLHNSLAARMA